MKRVINTLLIGFFAVSLITSCGVKTSPFPPKAMDSKEEKKEDS